MMVSDATHPEPDTSAEPDHSRPDATMRDLARAAMAGDPSELPSPEPDLGKLERALERPAARSIELTLLVVFAAVYTLYFARAVIVPIVFAVLLKLFLNPVIRGLQKLRVPLPLGAVAVVALLLALLGGSAYAVSGPAQAWIARAPHTITVASRRLRKLREPVEQVTRTAEQVESATDVTTPTSAREVVVRGPSLIARVFGTTTSLVAGLLEVTILLYFLLAGGDLFLQKLVRALPQLQDKRRAVLIAREIESSISTYLSTVLVINIGEGLAVAGAMWLLGLPNPLLWGVLAALLEFVPYLGAATMTAVLAIAGLTTFPDLGRAMLVPASFLAIALLQANFVSPVLLGHRLTLNPVAIFVGLGFWFFLWGIPGAFIAVPLLAAIKIFCERVEPLAPIGEFLGQ